jgi:hypothetical protein
LILGGYILLHWRWMARLFDKDTLAQMVYHGSLGSANSKCTLYASIEVFHWSRKIRFECGTMHQVWGGY